MSNHPNSDNNVTVKGTISFTNDAQGNDPRTPWGVPVQVFDQNLEAGVADRLLDTVFTDENGQFQATFANDTSAPENGLDLYVKIESKWDRYVIQDQNGNILSYDTTSSVQTDVASQQEYTIDLNEVKQHDQNPFNLIGSLRVADAYEQQISTNANSDNDTVTVDFPGSSSSYIDKNIELLSADYNDWDVMLHEYGHYLADVDKLDDYDGGEHSFGVSNIPDNGKDVGVRLAWGEGLANYVAISAPIVAANQLGTLPNISGLGDTLFSWYNSRKLYHRRISSNISMEFRK